MRNLNLHADGDIQTRESPPLFQHVLSLSGLSLRACNGLLHQGHIFRRIIGDMVRTTCGCSPQQSYGKSPASRRPTSLSLPRCQNWRRFIMIPPAQLDN